MPRQAANPYVNRKYKKATKSAPTKANAGYAIPRQYNRVKAPQRIPRAIAEKPPGMFAGMGGTAGGAIGSAWGPVGTAIGSFLGGKLGHLVEKITGFGDYTVHNNSIMKGGVTIPQIVNSVDRGSVILRHREYLAEIPSTVDFTIQKFVIQPGVSTSFPWLSQVANSFEQYALRGVIYEFNSTSSDSVLSTSTSSSLGSVMMSTDYDIADPAPVNKRQMLGNEYSCSAKPSQSFLHPIECKKSVTAQNMMYTRGIAVASGYDPRLYDFANFYIATEGMQGVAGSVGELWVTYEVELFKPQYNSNELSDWAGINNMTAARPLGTVVLKGTDRGMTIAGTLGGDGRSYVFPPNYSSGKFLMVYQNRGATAQTVGDFISGLTLTGCVLLNSFIDNNGNPTSSQQGSNSGVSNVLSLIVLVTVELKKPNAQIQFPTGSIVPTGGWGTVIVTRLPDTFTGV